jgi:serine/threonine-protein kinase
VAAAVAAGSARRRRLAVAGAGAALAAVVAGLAVWAGGGDGRQAVAGPPTSAAPTLACTATYWVRSDNGSRFTGELMLANTGPTVIDGEWTLTFQFPATQRLERFGGERAARLATHAGTATTAAATTAARGWGQDGQKVTAYPWRRDAKARRIDPQKQVTWTFEGAYEGSNPMPGAFAINGATCQPVLVGPVDAPPPTRFTPQENPRASTAAPRSGAPTPAASQAEPTTVPTAPDPQPTAGPPTAEPTGIELPPVTAILDLDPILDVG